LSALKLALSSLLQQAVSEPATLERDPERKWGLSMATGIRPPSQMERRSFQGKVTFQNFRGRTIAKRWPDKRGPKGTPAQMQARADFLVMINAVKDMMVQDQVAARDLADGCAYTWRDVLSKAVTGQFINIEGWAMALPNTLLDAITTVVGAMVMRTVDGWVGLVPTGDGKIIMLVDGLPVWTDLVIPPAGMTELHGDAVAGPGSGDQLLTLAASGVVAGSYTFGDFTVDAKGRITAAASGSPPAYIDELTGDVTAGPGSGSQAATLAASGVVAGGYTRSSLTVDAKGRLTAASSGVQDINQLTGDVTAGPGSGSQVATLAASGVTAGSYTVASITVDAKGRLTAASSGAPGSGAGLFNGSLSALPTSAGTGLTTWRNQGSATIADTPAGVVMTLPSNGSAENWRIRTKAAPGATPYSVTALIALSYNFTTADYVTGIGWSDGTKLQMFVVQCASAVDGPVLKVVNYSNPSTGIATVFTGTSRVKLPLMAWLRLEDDGTNVRFRISFDGVSFTEVYSIAKASGYLGATGYTNIVFGANPFSSNGTVTLMSYAEA
jgi:hypothetical protein